MVLQSVIGWSLTFTHDADNVISLSTLDITSLEIEIYKFFLTSENTKNPVKKGDGLMLDSDYQMSKRY